MTTRTTKTTRSGTALLAAGACALSLLGGPPPAAAEERTAGTPTTRAAEQAPRLAIPRGGRLPVSTEVLALTDRGRADPWRSGPRQLMVTMTYPTSRGGGERASYLSAAESRALLDFQEQQGAPIPEEVPRDLLAEVRVPASVGGPVRGERGSRPLVLLSPGFSLPRATLTGLATELAGRGYVVASVDHVGETTGTELPGGRLVRCAACDVEDYSRVPRVRVRDLSFVLDRLLGRRPAWAGARVVDESRIAAVGHSIGGNAAVSLLRDDDRLDAAVDLDGTFFDAVDEPLDRPVLMLGTESLHTPTGEDETWAAAWSRLTGPRTWLTVAGSTHFSGIDLPLLVDQAGLGDPGAPLSGRRALTIARDHVAAFLDLHLRGRDRGLLDGPSQRYPEVAFHDPS